MPVSPAPFLRALPLLAVFACGAPASTEADNSAEAQTSAAHPRIEIGADGSVTGPGRTLVRGENVDILYPRDSHVCRRIQEDFYVGRFLDEHHHAVPLNLHDGGGDFLTATLKVPNRAELDLWFELHDIFSHAICYDSQGGHNYRFAVR